MNFPWYRLLFALAFGAGLIALLRCGPEKPETKAPDAETKKYTYLNHDDSVGYVGMDACKQCHYDIWQTFIQTGMGQSFDHATKAKSKAKFDAHAAIYDKHSDFWYHPFWRGDSLYLAEFRLEGRDTVHKRVEKVDYIVGSGQHTNSHIFNLNGYLHQMPATFYTQEGKWDLPPGFENGFNTRFSRKIGLECMSCHNALPGFVQGSENKFTHVPGGISCERCHGPGALHVKEKSAGHLIDTSRFIDYTIVNPGKLSPDRQFDVCQRCHLQGNTVLKEGKTFYDFRPGMKLSDHMTVFMPKHEGGDDEFIMAAHAERLKMSPCFIRTNAKVKFDESALRPAKGAMTCVTCHNPHKSVKVTETEVFNSACSNCHQAAHKTDFPGASTLLCSESEAKRMAKNDNCVSCHMPRSGSIDIPHVTVTDHFIRKPVDVKKEKEQLKKFIGLYAVNEKEPSALTKAKGYIQQCEKFEPGNLYLLDSAKRYLADASEKDVRDNFALLVQLYYLKGDLKKVTAYAQRLGEKEVLEKVLVKKSYGNDDAWTAYRIGEAYFSTAGASFALPYYRKAAELAPAVPDFLAKHALALAGTQQHAEAMNVYRKILNEYPKYVPALTNLGYLHLVQGDVAKADELYNRALALDPDYEPLLLNKVGLLVFQKDLKGANVLLDRLLKKNPKNEKAKQIKAQLKTMK